MFSTITLNGQDYIALGEFVLYGDEWIWIDELINIQMYDGWVLDNPEPIMWGM